jgi:hypothetical protein
VMTNAALKSHSHSGGADSPKLAQVVTHESPDTDTATGIHHTIGTGANQAAAGNHIHDYNSDRITNKPYALCTSTTRPPSPYTGLHCFEIDTNRERIWCQLPDASDPSWRLTPGSPSKPVCRLRQDVAQQLASSGTIIEWDSEVEDNFGYWTNTAKTNVVVKEAGLYQIEAAIQWDASRVPDEAHLVLCINGQETTVRKSMWLRGNTFVPQFSQTVAVTGKLRFGPNDILTVKVSYKQPGGFIGFLLSFIDGTSKVKSRLDLAFIGC